MSTEPRDTWPEAVRIISEVITRHNNAKEEGEATTFSLPVQICYALVAENLLREE